MAGNLGNNKLVIFEDKEIRRILVNEEGHFSVVDVVQALTDNSNPINYWSMLKKRELENGIELYTICVQLKLKYKDGKKYLTDCADNEGILQIIQSIPSRKAESFKCWLAKIGAERLEEIEQPNRAIERSRNYYLVKGYAPEWVQTRIAGIETRHSFTDALKGSGIKENYEYAILTNELYRSTFGFTAGDYKTHKELTRKDSLRDNMTPLELASTIFSKAISKELIEETGTKRVCRNKNAIHLA